MEGENEIGVVQDGTGRAVGAADIHPPPARNNTLSFPEERLPAEPPPSRADYPRWEEYMAQYQSWMQRRNNRLANLRALITDARAGYLGSDAEQMTDAERARHDLIMRLTSEAGWVVDDASSITSFADPGPPPPAADPPPADPPPAAAAGAASASDPPPATATAPSDMLFGKSIAYLEGVREELGPSLFADSLIWAFPNKAERDIVRKRFPKTIDHVLPAGGYGSAFAPSGQQPIDQSERYKFERHIRDSFAVSRTGQALGDLRYLQMKKDREAASGGASASLPQGGTAGLRYMFEKLRTAKIDPETNCIQGADEIFGPLQCDQLMAIQQKAGADAVEASHLMSEIIPCPGLKRADDMSGNANGTHLKSVQTILQNRKFSGKKESQHSKKEDYISSSDFFRSMREFIDNDFNPKAAYMLLKSATTGKPYKLLNSCESSQTGFPHAWDSLMHFFISERNPDEAEQRIIDLRSERPTDIKQRILDLTDLCDVAAYSQAPENRHSYSQFKFREEADKLIRTYYPFTHKAITLRDTHLGNLWKTEREGLLRRGENPDLCTTHYHPLWTYQQIIVEEIGDLQALEITKKLRVDRKGGKRTVQVISADQPSAPSKMDPKIADAISSFMQQRDRSHELPQESSSMDTDSDPGSEDESGEEEGGESDSAPAEYDTHAMATKPFFRHTPKVAGVKPKAKDGGAKPKGRDRDANKSRVCILCSGPHSYTYCDIYPNQDPVNERCTRAECGLFHPPPCLYHEAVKKIKEKALKKAERERAKKTD